MLMLTTEECSLLPIINIWHHLLTFTLVFGLVDPSHYSLLYYRDTVSL